MAEINKAAGLVTNKVETSLSVKGGLTLRTALPFVMDSTRQGLYGLRRHAASSVRRSCRIVNYTLEVQPGPVYTMGKLTIENSADDLRAAMLAAWKLPTGAVFDESALRAYFAKQDPRTALGQTFLSANCIYKLTRDNDAHT